MLLLLLESVLFVLKRSPRLTLLRPHVPHSQPKTHPLDDVRAWYAYYFPPDVSWKDSLGTILLQSLQSLWGRIQYLASGAVWEKVADWTRRIRHAAMTRGGGDGDGDNAEMTHHDAAFRTIRADDLPALEATPVAPGALAAVVVSEEETRPKSSPSPRTRINTAPLEPAFLRESDYPPGWLVYHRVLGVVTKSEADDYNEKMGFPEDHDGEEDEVEDDLDDEEKKDEPSAAASTEEDMDEEKTVHHSNKSTGRNAAKAASTDNESSSSSSSNKKQSSSSFPIQHSIAASG